MSYICACQGLNSQCPMCAGSGITGANRIIGTRRVTTSHKGKNAQLLRKRAKWILEQQGILKATEQQIMQLVVALAEGAEPRQLVQLEMERQERERVVRRILDAKTPREQAPDFST